MEFYDEQMYAYDMSKAKNCYDTLMEREAIDAALTRVTVRKAQYALSPSILSTLSTLPDITSAKPMDFLDITTFSLPHNMDPMQVWGTERSQIILDKEHEHMYILFYSKDWTNFAELEDQFIAVGNYKIRSKCSEATFKAACYGMHIRDGLCPEVDIAHVFTALTPVEIKQSTKKIKNFNQTAWDTVSKDAMTWAVAHRLRSPTAFAQMKDYQELAQTYGYGLDRVVFAEVTVHDTIWGNGMNSRELVKAMLAYKGHNLYDDVVAKHGMNQLGQCLGDAFLAASRHETVEDYCKWFDSEVQPVFVVQ